MHDGVLPQSFPIRLATEHAKGVDMKCTTGQRNWALERKLMTVHQLAASWILPVQACDAEQMMVLAGSSGVIWGGFLLLTGVHIYANVRAVRALRLSSLNAPRLQLLLSHALQHPVSNCG